MAKGLFGFLGFGKRSKPNLTQAFRMPPSASDAPLYGDLRQLASQRIKAGTTGEEIPGVGFGPDFVNKSTNSQAQRMRQDFRDYTDPYLDSELSKRGVARSAGGGLATDIKTRAYQANTSDIDQMIERFYTLNEQQKKQDITQGIGVGENLNNQYLQQGNTQASQFNAAEAGNTARTASLAATNNANSLDRQNDVLQAAGGFLGGGGLGNLGHLFSKIPGLSPLGGAFSSLDTLGKNVGNTSSVLLNNQEDKNSLLSELIKRGII